MVRRTSESLVPGTISVASYCPFMTTKFLPVLALLCALNSAIAQNEYLVPSVPRIEKIESELSSLAERVTALEKGGPTPAPTASPNPTQPPTPTPSPTPSPTAMPTPSATPPTGGGQTWETNGQQSSVADALGKARDGDTIQLPAGNFTWNATLTIEKAVTLTGVAGATTITNARGQGSLVVLKPQAGGPVELKNLKFASNGGGSGCIHLNVGNGPGAKPPLVHHCRFEMRNFGERAIEWGNNGGVIYDDEFVSTNKADISCIAFKNPQDSDSWKSPSSVGKGGDPNGDKNTYLEDCTFKDAFLQALDFDDNSRTVCRHCTFDNSAISSHGQDTSPQGLREFEVMHNKFIFEIGGNCNPNPYPLNINYWFYVRGGGASVIFDNDFPKVSSCAWGSKPSISLTVYNIRRRSAFIPCQTRYPASRQLGFGSNTSGAMVSEPLYIWGNTGTGANEIGLVNYSPDDCGNNQQIGDYIKKDRDYFLAAKSGYVEFTYPHPARR